jgi:hypothetical protein
MGALTNEVKKKKRPNNARPPYNSVGIEKVATFENMKKMRK